jgi:hypothetical protein
VPFSHLNGGLIRHNVLLVERLQKTPPVFSQIFLLCLSRASIDKRLTPLALMNEPWRKKEMRFPDYLRQGKRGIPLPAQRRAWIRQPKVLLGVPQRLVERQHVYQKENPRHSLFERFPNVCPEPVLVK